MKKAVSDTSGIAHQRTQTYILLERWADLAAAQDHLKAPHVVSAVAKLLPLVPGGEIPEAVRITKL